MMRSKILTAALATGIGLATISAPAFATSATQSVSVNVVAATEATIAVAYSAGSNISCAVGTAVVGPVACTNTATLSGSIRTTVLDTGGTSVTLTGANIVGLANTIAPTALTLACTGGLTGTPTFGGVAGTLPTAAAMSTAPTTCQSWTGTVVDTYSLIATLSIDAGKVPADTYTAANFTATVTAN